MRLKELREEKDLTQNDVATAINTTRTNIGRWEKGLNEPTSGFIIQLANFFEVTTDYLLEREDDFGNITIKNPPTEKLSAEDKELLEYFHTLTKSEKIQVTEYTRYLSERGESQKKPVRKNKLA